ncbi:hypothetical protein [Actinomadura nitritigenes]|uniref:hypothetical protein n=1 Tax=Actinomadura nitritigenes TaxID=134602 RepID=UPI003D8BE78B
MGDKFDRLVERLLDAVERWLYRKEMRRPPRPPGVGYPRYHDSTCLHEHGVKKLRKMDSGVPNWICRDCGRIVGHGVHWHP